MPWVNYPRHYLFIEKNNMQIRTNKPAIISFVASFVVFLSLWLIPVVGMACSIIGIVYGYKGLEQTKDAYQSGAGMARAGIITGYLSLIMSFLWTAFWNFWWFVFLSEVKM